MAIKRKNKVVLSEMVKNEIDVSIDPDALFDSQIKRLHEYKRQHLNSCICSPLPATFVRSKLDLSPRVFLFGAKAAPGHHLAKVIIHAINLVGQRINEDPRVKGKLKVAYWPNYGVSSAERIIPATDPSEQTRPQGKRRREPET